MSKSLQDPLGLRSGPLRATGDERSSVIPFRGADTLANTIPPTPLRDLLAADGASVYVLTQDGALLETVCKAGGEHYPVSRAKSWDALREAVTQRHCGIALLDAEAVDGPVDARLAELARLNPALVTLVAVERDRVDALIDLLSERKIHRLLVKPAALGVTQLLLESAVNRYLQLRQQHPSIEAPRRERVTARPSRRWSRWLMATAVVLALLVAAIVPGYLDMPEETPGDDASAPAADATAPEVAPDATPDAAPSREATPATAAVPPVGSTTPAEGAAAPADRAAAVTAPASEAAPTPSAPPAAAADAGRDAVEAADRFAEVEAALAANRLDRAADLLDDLEAAAPGSPRLAFLRAQLDGARTAATAATAGTVGTAGTPSELTNLIDLTRTRIEQEQITTPAGDSALDYFERAQAVNPRAPELQPLASELGAALLTAAEIELAQGRFAAAEVLFTEAQTFGVSEEELVGLELSLTYARDALARSEQDALIVQARQRIASGALFAPASGNPLDALLEVRRRNARHPQLAPALAELREALQVSAETALAAGDWGTADRALEALERAGAPAGTVAGLGAELAFGRRQAAYLEEPAPVGALTLLDSEPPVYPRGAIARGTEGWVGLEFVVDRQGRPRDLVVTGAEPEGEFETAALAAAETYQFEPFEIDGRTYERRVALRMRFALE